MTVSKGFWTPSLLCHRSWFSNTYTNTPTHAHTHTHTLSDRRVPDSWWGHQISLTNTLTLQVRHSESQYSAPASPFLWLPSSPLLPSLAPNIIRYPWWTSSQNHRMRSSSHTHPYTHTYTHTHTHSLTTEAEAWWSHTNKAATRNTWCCDSTSSMTAEDIKHGRPPDNPTVMSLSHCCPKKQL